MFNVLKEGKDAWKQILFGYSPGGRLGADSRASLRSGLLAKRSDPRALVWRTALHAEAPAFRWVWAGRDGPIGSSEH